MASWKSKMIDLPEDQLNLIRAIFQKYLPGRDIVVFGSRAGSGKAKTYSDIDLCIMGNDAVHPAVIADLRNALSESDIPIKVDVVDWAATQPEFRKIIGKQAVPL